MSGQLICSTVVDREEAERIKTACYVFDGAYKEFKYGDRVLVQVTFPIGSAGIWLLARVLGHKD
jgi:hypothetical protein